MNVGAPGTTFNVNIVIQDVADLGGFEFSVNYNSPIFTIADKSQVTLGAFLGSTDRTATALDPAIDNTAGKVTFGAFSFGSADGPSVSGTSLGGLATITFTVQSQADGLLDLNSVDITDTEAIPLTVDNIGDCILQPPTLPTVKPRQRFIGITSRTATGGGTVTSTGVSARSPSGACAGAPQPIRL